MFVAIAVGGWVADGVVLTLVPGTGVEVLVGVGVEVGGGRGVGDGLMAIPWRITRANWFESLSICT